VLFRSPRVHHNSEVTLKLTVEVSNLGANAPGTGANGVPAQPTFATRTIESTIRLKDGETNFLAGLIQDSNATADTKTPFLGDIPFLGRFFTETNTHRLRTDLVLTMTPHIVRMPDITEDDVAPMWVGTQNNLTFRGVSPRIESQTSGDPFTARPLAGMQVNPDGDPAAAPPPAVTPNGRPVIPGGTAPTNVFNPNNPPNTQPPPNPEPQASNGLAPATSTTAAASRVTSMASTATAADLISPSDVATLRTAPRIGPQPVTLKVKPGEQKLWSVIGMDLDGLNTNALTLHYDAHSIDVSEVIFGSALTIDAKTPPVATINRDTGTIRITSSDGKPLQFTGGGEIVSLRVRGGKAGETFLIMESPEFQNAAGATVNTAVSGGRARVEQ